MNLKKVPLCSSAQLIRVLEHHGFARGPVHRGSHQQYVKHGPPKISVTIVEGRREIARTTLLKILERARISLDDFKQDLK